MLRVVIRVDADGEWPVLVDDSDELQAAEGVSFRYVCDVSTAAEGNAVLLEWLSRRLPPKVFTPPFPSESWPI